MPERGFEPPRPCGHSDLNAACMPISPLGPASELGLHFASLFTGRYGILALPFPQNLCEILGSPLFYCLTRFVSMYQELKSEKRSAGVTTVLRAAPLIFTGKLYTYKLRDRKIAGTTPTKIS